VSFGALVALFVAVNVAAVVASALAGSRIRALRGAPAMVRMVVVLSGLVLTAAVVALALGGPGRDQECSGPLRDGVAAFISIFAIPSIVIAAFVGVGAIFGSRSSWRLSAAAVAGAVAAGVVDWFALLDSVHLCLD
jgi:hypothetical protein